MAAKNWARLAVTGALVALAGCATVRGESKDATVDEGRLAGVPPEDLKGVDQARQELVQAQTQLDQSKQAVLEADKRVKLGEAEVERAEATLEQAKLQEKTRQKSGATRGGLLRPDEELQVLPAQATTGQGTGQYGSPAQPGTGQPGTGQQQGITGQQATEPIPSVMEAQLRLDTAKAQLDYFKQLKGVAEAQQKLVERQVTLAQAKVEQAKYDAVTKAGKGGGPEWEQQGAKFHERIANAQADIAKANADISKERASAVEKYQAWQRLDEQTGGMQRRVEVPPPPRG